MPRDWLTFQGMKTPDAIKLEPDFREPFRAFKASPSPATRGAMLRAVSPVLDAGIKSYGGASAGPGLRSKARQIAVKAFDTYDPEKAGLKTHLMGHLQGLQRLADQPARGFSVPERVLLDRRRLADAEGELGDLAGGVPPSTQQLADHLGMSMKRIAQVRSYRPGFAEGQIEAMGPQDGEDAGTGPAVVGPDATMAKLDFIYHDLDPINQSIVEHAFGLHGRPRMRPGQIATALNLTPGAISQRTAKIRAMLDQLDDAALF